MKCYYHGSSEVTGQCPSCSKFLCKVCLDEYETNFCRDCTKKKYNLFCEEFETKLKMKIEWQKDKIQLAASAVKRIKFKAITKTIIYGPLSIIFFGLFGLLPLVFILNRIFPPGNFFIWVSNIIFFLALILLFTLPFYLIATSMIASGGAALHRELKERERTENKTIDFSPEMQAVFSGLRLIATSVSPFGRDQIYEEPGESDVFFTRLKRSIILKLHAISAPIIYKKIKAMQQQLVDDLEQLQQFTPPSFEKFVSVQSTLLAEQKQKPILPEI